jgi:hypothetical protein
MNLEGKLEQAFKLFLDADSTIADARLTVFTGVDHEELTLPCVVCHCQGGEETPMDSSNHMMLLFVHVKTKLDASDPNNPTEDLTAAHNTNVQTVRTALNQDDLADQLSALVDDFYAFHPVIPGPTQNDVDGRRARTTKQYQVYCCAADLT